MEKNSKYSFLVEVETNDSLVSQDIKAIKDFLSTLHQKKIETEFYEVNIYDTRVKYLGEKY